MVNKLWIAFITIGIVFSIFIGQGQIVNEEIINSTKTTLEIILNLLPIIALWNGLMTIAKDSGLLNKISNLLAPLICKIFPEIPKGHESISLIATDFVVNMVGLGNASTPIGLKVMKSLQELNQEKDTASRSMITFLIMNTAGFTIVPTTIISLRMLHGSTNPTGVVSMIILTSFLTFCIGLLIDRMYYVIRRRK